jgi:hypothetical protein
MNNSTRINPCAFLVGILQTFKEIIRINLILLTIPVQGGRTEMKEWEVTIIWKDGRESSYVYEGNKEEARCDAYLSSPQGEIRNVIVKPAP